MVLKPSIMFSVGVTAARPPLARGDRSGSRKKFCMSIMTRAVRLGSMRADLREPEKTLVRLLGLVVGRTEERVRS